MKDKRLKEFGEDMHTIEKGLYRHYKGNIYKVLCVAKHSETLEDMVIYQDASDEMKIWARPASMWNEEVSRDGETVRRFEAYCIEEKRK